MDIQITPGDGHSIRLGNEIPEHLAKYKLKGATPILGVSEFGNMFFQHVAGKEVDIWYSTYSIDHAVTLKARANFSVLELTIPFRNHFSSRWDGIPQSAIAEKQFELSYAPFVSNEARFPVTGDYQTFDLHYHRPLLESFAVHFPQLNIFLDKTEKQQPASLFNSQRFLNPWMIEVINSMLRYDFIEGLAPAFYESKAIELLIYALQSSITVKPSVFFSPWLLERAREAAAIISSNPANQYTATELAKKTATNVYSLKTAFRSLYGCSLFRFAEQTRMEFAKQLLLDHKMSITEIATRAGYPDHQNFSNAFKRIFKVSPLVFRHKGK